MCVGMKVLAKVSLLAPGQETTPSPLALALLMRSAETSDAGIDACCCSPLLLVQAGQSGALRVPVALGLPASQWAGRGQTFASSSFSRATARYQAAGKRA